MSKHLTKPRGGRVQTTSPTPDAKVPPKRKRAVGPLYKPTDVTPEKFFKEISRKQAGLMIDFLIEILDSTTDADAEPSLGSTDVLAQTRWASGNSDEREGDPGCDDREDDPADGPEEVNEDGDGNPDDEPSLGWTAQMAQGQGTWGDNGDLEQASSTLTAAAHARYKHFDRYEDNRDGKHVDAERGFGHASRRIRNVSDKQRELLAPLIDRSKVRL